MKHRMIRLCAPILIAGSLIAVTAASASADDAFIHDFFLNGSKSATPTAEQQAAPVRVRPQDQQIPARDLCLGTRIDRMYGGC